MPKTPIIRKLRPKLEPGRICILLSGAFKGRRVIILKQLDRTGLLLVTGPFSINGVALRRADPSYVIATSEKLDLTNMDFSSISDEYFEATKKSKQKLKESETFFKEVQTKVAVSDERKQRQKQIDSQLLPLIKAVPHLKDYLGARFSLSRSQYPHELIF